MSFLLLSELNSAVPTAELFILDSWGRWGCVMQAGLPSLVLTPLSVMSGGAGSQASCPLLSLLTQSCPSLNEPQASSLEPDKNHSAHWLGFPILLPGAWEGYKSQARKARLGQVMLNELKRHLSLGVEALTAKPCDIHA